MKGSGMEPLIVLQPITLPTLFLIRMWNFRWLPFGIVGLETLLPLLLNQIREKSGLDLLTLLGLVTCNPARVMNLPGGTIEIGVPADLTLWNPEPGQ